MTVNRELGSTRETRRDQRQYGRDAGAGGDRGIVPGAGRIEGGGEVTERRHHVDRLPGPQLGRHERRKHATGHRLDADAQATVAGEVVGRRGDRVRPPDVLAVHESPHGQVLAGPERVRLAEFRRHRERDRDRIVDEPRHVRHFERMKLRAATHRPRDGDGHGQCALMWSNGSRHSVQRQSDLHAVDPKRDSSCVAGDPQRGQRTAICSST